MNKKRELLEKLSELVNNVLGDNFSHGFPHVVRVRRISWEIVDNIDAEVDPFLLDASILLHDIGRVIGEPHAYYSALFARAYLLEHGIESRCVEKVVNAILYHSFSYARRHGIKPMTVEAMILSDADKLDALGIVGFLRVFHYGWEHKRSIEQSINHFYEKIFKLPELMHFEYTRKKAEELVTTTKWALDRLLDEIGSDWGSQKHHRLT